MSFRSFCLLILCFYFLSLTLFLLLTLLKMSPFSSPCPPLPSPCPPSLLVLTTLLSLSMHICSLLNFISILTWGHAYGERRREGEREGEKHWCERETRISCLSHVPQQEIEPITQAYALTGNWTHILLFYEMMLQPTEPHWLGCIYVLFWLLIFFSWNFDIWGRTVAY